MAEVVTLTDVARAAGVSPSTVSRILSGTARVTPETRQKVMGEIERLDYQPNILAQGLKRGQSMTVGVLTQELNSPFFDGTVQGIEFGFEDSDYDPIFAGGHSRKSEEKRVLEVLGRRRVDAMIIVGGFLPDPLLVELARSTVLVIVGRKVSGLEEQCIYIDNVKGGFDATKHLIDLGHRRIAHITGIPSNLDAIDRFQGYRQALESARIPYDHQLVVEGAYTEQSGLFAVETLLSRGNRFTAVFCANDQMACGARLAFYRRGMRVPDDISLVGFDGLQYVLFAIPPLTTIRQPMFEMGQGAARLTLSLLEGKKPPHITFATPLLVRESTAMAR